MARQGKRSNSKKIIESSNSSSSSEQSSEEDDSSVNNSENERTRGNKKKNTFTEKRRKPAQRKGTNLSKRQGTHVENLDNDDFNMPNRSGQRKPTQRMENDIKQRNQQKEKTIANTQIINLQQELQTEKMKKEQIQKEKEEQEKQTLNQMSNLQQEKMSLLRKAGQKLTYMNVIKEKLVESNENDLTIITGSKKGSESFLVFGKCFLVQRITDWLYNHYFLSKLCYTMGNYFNIKAYQHFGLLAFFFNSCLFSLIIFLPVYFSSITNSTSGLSELAKFFSFSLQPSVIFLICNLAFLLIQVVAVFNKFNKQKVRRVKEIAQFNNRINVFKLAMADYNWKVSNRIQLEKTQLALIQRAKFILNHSELESELSKQSVFKIFALRILGFVFLIAILLVQMYNFISDQILPYIIPTQYHPQISNQTQNLFSLSFQQTYFLCVQ